MDGFSAKDAARSKRKHSQRANAKHGRGGGQKGKAKAKKAAVDDRVRVGAPPKPETKIEVEYVEKKSALEAKYGKREKGSNAYRFEQAERAEAEMARQPTGANLSTLLDLDGEGGDYAELESTAGAYFQLLDLSSSASYESGRGGINVAALGASLMQVDGLQRLYLSDISPALETAIRSMPSMQPIAAGAVVSADATESLLQQLQKEETGDSDSKEVGEGVVKKGEKEMEGEEKEDEEEGDELEDWLDSVL